jgi:lycopene beta-cyclase
MAQNGFDIAIIGAGAAGLHLALAMKENAFFANKKILLLDKDNKDQNDRTWCFWEKGQGKWDQLLRKSWSEGDFFGRAQHQALDLAPYRYKMLRGLDFYRFAKAELAGQPNFQWQQDEVREVVNGPSLHIECSGAGYQASLVFDSRVPADFPPLPNGNKTYTHLLQHFKGWFVRTPEDQFNPARFTMMDYRIGYKDSSSFTYLLPVSPREALVEFTLFTGSLIPSSDYDEMLRSYCDKVLKIKDFEIEETEYGVIPMSDFDFQNHSQSNHIRIGTGGGWVKPSTGYSFKNCERNAARICANLAAGKPANRGLFSRRFRFYDTVFLDVLSRNNHLGPSLFETMYFKNKVQDIFAFLDDESSPAQDLGIIMGFPKWLFTKSMLKTRFR